jgi:plasmid maintenance system killer protein
MRLEGNEARADAAGAKEARTLQQQLDELQAAEEEAAMQQLPWNERRKARNAR